jgi:membrane associated rhomboid family serine protease
MTNRATTPRTDGFRAVIGMVALMWVIEVVDAIDGQGLDVEGIRPRQLPGLVGVVLGPFLHASFGHLIANTLPFLVLGLTIAFEGALRVLAVTAVVGLVAGIGTWLVAPDGTTTIGASGLVFGYAAYLIARGVFTRRAGQLAIGVTVLLLFGGALLGSLVPQAGISWEDHLFGGLGGILAARVLTAARPGARPPATRLAA